MRLVKAILLLGMVGLVLVGCADTVTEDELIDGVTLDTESLT